MPRISLPLSTALGLTFALALAASAALAHPAGAVADPGTPAAPASLSQTSVTGSTSTIVAGAGICVWSCQQNPSGSWAYWFARNLSDCAVTDCLPRGGSSPSGTACTQGDPDIPGDCRAQDTTFTTTSGATLASILSPTPRCAATSAPAPPAAR
jgi:hypothetical protein